MPDLVYLYTSKEYQNFSLGGTSEEFFDFGARAYDPVTARWNSFDPLGEMDYGGSPYMNVFNNPIVFYDPNGMEAVTVLDLVEEAWDKVPDEGYGYFEFQDGGLACFEVENGYDPRLAYLTASYITTYGPYFGPAYALEKYNSIKKAQSGGDIHTEKDPYFAISFEVGLNIGLKQKLKVWGFGEESQFGYSYTFYKGQLSEFGYMDEKALFRALREYNAKLGWPGFSIGILDGKFSYDVLSLSGTGKVIPRMVLLEYKKGFPINASIKISVSPRIFLDPTYGDFMEKVRISNNGRMFPVTF